MAMLRRKALSAINGSIPSVRTVTEIRIVRVAITTTVITTGRTAAISSVRESITLSLTARRSPRVKILKTKFRKEAINSVITTTIAKAITIITTVRAATTTRIAKAATTTRTVRAATTTRTVRAATTIRTVRAAVTTIRTAAVRSPAAARASLRVQRE